MTKASQDRNAVDGESAGTLSSLRHGDLDRMWHKQTVTKSCLNGSRYHLHRERRAATKPLCTNRWVQPAMAELENTSMASYWTLLYTDSNHWGLVPSVGRTVSSLEIG